ncbi:hypothetical protein [Leisingera sp.]|uniref:hypothetical protein n=1 Tax=Leisingera sp. TaxID=1879318 RepID=UPI002B26D180|nr:hypothetical protein [Leisingera sp.]
MGMRRAERGPPNLQNKYQGHQPLQIPIEPADPPTSNPAISRLRVSPTPGNAAHHSNIARGVRETCIKQPLSGTAANGTGLIAGLIAGLPAGA